ncbi:hypothetical protein HG536_0E04810 [Torulaspora globosa]|uniref:Crh-like protein n=1 Tax=Torulaspora globosa TaxID=48254 RepID=A0A7G3ZJ84_9SACH|nr:uncharacterized protein HG536_0E04810 [Torulaspora globosa]QLL33570.1 hypothetical protein HG536_0E04810 [Torulaspora globosa]
MVKAGLVSAIAIASFWSRVVNGQSSTVAGDCNPLKSTNCSPDKALATSFAEDFSSESDWFEKDNDSGEINYGSDGLQMTLAKRYDNPGLKSKFYLMYGKVEAVLKAGPGTGIVSSFFLQSDDLDEIDLEWVGSDDTQFQSNYFSKGNVATYDRGAFHGVSQPQAEFHNYTIDWAMDKTVWYLDGQPVRTLENTTSEGYPQSPMFLKMGIWAGGDPSNEPGTIEWAGGLVDYSKAPFSMYIKKIVVTDYSSGSEYSYGDQSGSWESIKAKDGSVYGRYDVAQQEFAALSNGEAISNSTTTSSTSSTISSSILSSSAASSSTLSSSAVSSSTLSSSAVSSFTLSSSAVSSSALSSSSSGFSESSASSAISSTAKASSETSSSTTSSAASSTTSASPETSSAASSSVSSSSGPSEASASSHSSEVNTSPTAVSTLQPSTEKPSLTTSTSRAQESTKSSSAVSVLVSNEGILVSYSCGLTGLLTGLALALVC